MMKLSLLSMIVATMFINVGCSEKQIVEEPDKVVEEEIIEQEPVEEVDIDADRFELMRQRVQTQLSVFDAGVYEQPLMEVIHQKISSAVTRDAASDIVEDCIMELLPQWHRQIVVSTLDFEVGKGMYSSRDVDKMMSGTSMKPLVPLIREYAIAKLHQEGKIVD